MTTANGITKESTFAPELVQSVFSKVRGHSSLAILSGQDGIPFTGKEYVTLSMDGEVSIVGEAGAKPDGAATKGAVNVVPLKVVYQKRFSDEFMKCSEEKQLDFLEKFNEGLSIKIARALDIMAFHGVDPATKESSSIIGTNNFDSAITGGAIIEYDSTKPDVNIDNAIAAVEGHEYECSGIAMAPAMRSAIADMRTGEGGRAYPEFAFGGKPGNLGSQQLDVNATVAFNSSNIRAIVGDFENAFVWGLCDSIEFDIIEYGDPDGQGTDLKNRNQVCFRAEAYIGWGILDKDAFASVEVVDTP